jgi:hypothetical protein
MTPSLLCRLPPATDTTAKLRHPAGVKNTTCSSSNRTNLRICPARDLSTAGATSPRKTRVPSSSGQSPSGCYYNASAIPRKAARARSAPHCRPNSVFSTGRYFSGGLRSRSRLTVNSMSPSASSRQCSISVKYASAGKNRNSLRARQRAFFCGSLKCTRQNLLSR